MISLIQKVGNYGTCKVFLHQPIIEFAFGLEIMASPPLPFSVRVKAVKRVFLRLV